MTAGLLDTDILLSYREADDTSAAFVERVRSAGMIQVSRASVLALLKWCKDERDQSVIDTFLKPVVVHELTAAISRKAFTIIRPLAPPYVLSPVDMLVAATAVLLKLPLYSLDPDRYAGVPGLTVLPAR